MIYILFTIMIVQIILMILNLYFTLKVTKTEEHKPIDMLEYIRSVEFNKKLDGLIYPMLDKASNEEIIKRSVKELKRTDKNMQYINQKDLINYIRDILSNYNNNYKEAEIESLEEEIDQKPSAYYDPALDMNLRSTNSISNALNSFYND